MTFDHLNSNIDDERLLINPREGRDKLLKALFTLVDCMYSVYLVQLLAWATQTGESLIRRIAQRRLPVASNTLTS